MSILTKDVVTNLIIKETESKILQEIENESEKKTKTNHKGERKKIIKSSI